MNNFERLEKAYLAKAFELASGRSSQPVSFEQIKDELGISDDENEAVIHILAKSVLVSLTFGHLSFTGRGIIETKEYISELSKERDSVILKAIYELAGKKVNNLVEHSKLAKHLKTTVQQLQPFVNILVTEKGYLQEADEGVWLTNDSLVYLLKEKEESEEAFIREIQMETNHLLEQSNLETRISLFERVLSLPSSHKKKNMKKKLQIFISSTFTDLIEERQAAVSAILKAGHIPAGMELFTSGNESQMNIIKKWIDESDIYMLILGGRYGSIDSKTQLSYTELEYDYAVKIKKPFFAVVINEDALEKKARKKGTKIIEKENFQKLKDFRGKVLSKIAEFFKDSRDIQHIIPNVLLRLKDEHEFRGWIPGDRIPNVEEYKAEIKKLNTEIEKLKQQINDSSSVINNYGHVKVESSVSGEQVVSWFKNYLTSLFEILEETHLNFANGTFTFIYPNASQTEMRLAEATFFDFKKWNQVSSFSAAKQFLLKFPAYKNRISSFYNLVVDFANSINNFADYLWRRPEFEQKVRETYERMMANRNPNYPPIYNQDFDKVLQLYTREWLTQYINFADLHPVKLKKQFALIKVYNLLKLKLPSFAPFPQLNNVKDLFEDLDQSEIVINTADRLNSEMKVIETEAKDLNEELSNLYTVYRSKKR